MELRHLRYFVTVAETLNFTTAARQLSMAQPPLSIQIRKLEAELGSALFDRSSRKIQLTSAGAAFLKDARDLLSMADRACQNLQDTAAGRLGEIVIRHTSSALSDRITRRLRKFIRKHRGVRISLEEIEYTEIPSYSLPGYDAAIHDILAGETASGGVVLETAPIVVAVAAKHRLATHTEIAPADLLGERILLAQKDQRTAAERYFATLLGDLDIVVVPAPKTPVQRLWQASLGLGVTVCASTDRFAPDAVLIPLAGAGSEVVTLLTPNPNSHAAGLPVLMDFIRD